MLGFLYQFCYTIVEGYLLQAMHAIAFISTAAFLLWHTTLLGYGFLVPT